MNAIPQLEVECTHCNGSGGEYDSDKWYPCQFCQGAGFLPTPDGQRIIALMRHNFGPLLQNAIRD
jgi:DnaJ-class molecular chaperone